MSTLSFVVRDSTFVFPVDKVPNGCLLSELSKEDFGNGKIMLDLDPKEFELIHKYLIEGTLSRELYLTIPHLFEYLMIDYNEFGYPQEFFEIKKKEDFIRKNFNDPAFINHPMRSMYYNLIELTEDVYNDIFVNCAPIKDSRIILKVGEYTTRSYTEFVEYINLISIYYKLDTHKGLVIAGGSLITTALNLHPNDVDLFLVDRDVSDIENLLSKYTTHDHPKFYRTQNCISAMIRSTKVKVKTSSSKEKENMKKIMYNLRKCELQIILRNYTSVSEVVTGFDVDCCGICYDIESKKFWLTPRAMYAIKHRTNIVDFDRLSPSYEHRLIKYSRRGFGIFVPFFEPSKIDIIKIAETIANKGIDDGKRRRSKKYDEITGVGLDLLIKSMYSTATFNKKKIPRDYDIFTNACSYLNDIYCDSFIPIEVPHKSLSNVTKYLGKKLGMRMIETNEVIEGRRKYIVFVYEYPDFRVDMLDALKDYNVIVGGYYTFGNFCVTFNQASKALRENKRLIQFYMTADYREIMMLQDTDYCILKNFTTLTQGVELMTVNPGQQLTGSFHKLVLDDYRAWYKSELYTF